MEQACALVTVKSCTQPLCPKFKHFLSEHSNFPEKIELARMAGVHNFIPSTMSPDKHSLWKNVALTPPALAYVASATFSLEECCRISEGKTGHDEPSSRFATFFQGECCSGDIEYILRHCRSYNTLCRQRRILPGRMLQWRHMVQ